MRRISANYIFTCEDENPLKNGIIEINDENIISQVIENSEAKEFASTEFFNGIIVPQFINVIQLPEEERKRIRNKEKKIEGKLFFHVGLFLDNIDELKEDLKEEFKENNEKFCLGINHWGKNYQQEIFNEIKFIQHIFPFLKFSEILKWTTINNAQAQSIDDKYGSIKVGKKAVLGLIYPFDFKENKLKTGSKLITDF